MGIGHASHPLPLTISSVAALLLTGGGCDAFISSGSNIVSVAGSVHPTIGVLQRGQIMTEIRSRTSAGRRAQRPIAQPTRMSAEGEAEPGFVEQFTTGWSTVIPVGNPDDLPSCPSGVSDMSNPAQAATFAAVFAGLAAGTIALLGGLSSLESALPAGWYSTWEWTWPLGLGPIFFAAGVAHFTALEGFCGIYPGRGAWGFWYLPGTASFHVKWTGVAEMAGGLGLLLGGLGIGPPGLLQASAAGLFALTLAVTPANIYMFTHGAQFPVGLEVPVVGHVIRGVFQCVLLAFFLSLATQ